MSVELKDDIDGEVTPVIDKVSPAWLQSVPLHEYALKSPPNPVPSTKAIDDEFKADNEIDDILGRVNLLPT